MTPSISATVVPPIDGFVIAAAWARPSPAQPAPAYAPASSAAVPDDLAAALAASPAAAAFFATLKGASRYAILYRIGAAKKAKTRARKIADSSA